jgi:phage baseplate assembly protein V
MTAGRGQYDRRGKPQSPTIRLNALQRRLEQSVQYGRVEEVDHAKARARVRISSPNALTEGRVTDWIPWSTGLADSGSVNWNPLQVGAQVVVMAPSGDPRQASILPGVYQNAHPSFSDSGSLYGSQYSDGGKMTYDTESSQYDISVPGGGAIKLGCGASSIEITDGKITVTGAEVVVDGASLKHNDKEVGDTHTHGGIATGPSDTDVPT